MNIKKVKESLKLVKDNSDWCVSSIDEYIGDLVIAIADFLIEKEKECVQVSNSAPSDFQEYVTVREFIQSNPLFSPTVVYRFCNDEEGLDTNLVIRKSGKWYLHPLRSRKAIMATNSTYKKRCERIQKAVEKFASRGIEFNILNDTSEKT